MTDKARTEVETIRCDVLNKRPRSNNRSKRATGHVAIDGGSLTLGDLLAVARRYAPVALSPESLKRMETSSSRVAEWSNNHRVMYGVTTGFGKMINCLVPPDSEPNLQMNLIRSHAASVGQPFPVEVVRAGMLLRINCLAQGYSGVRPETVSALVGMLNGKVHPVVPEIGSVGASGDLSPLAHIALVATGEWYAEFHGKTLKAETALKRAGIPKITLSYKEGLALINGTSMMSALGGLAVADALNLIRSAEVVSALSLEVLKASSKAFDEKGMMVKPHAGQILTARNIRHLLRGSQLIRSQKKISTVLERELREGIAQSTTDLQDAYSLRCIPQIMGSLRDALVYVQTSIETEMNAVSDNPLIFPDEEDIFHGGHFHGQPVALPLDVLAIAMTELAVVSERRIDRYLNSHYSKGLPPFLVNGAAGLNCGFAGAQYTASAIVAENRILCHPASVQSIPSNGNNQDVVSMGLIAARKANQILKNSVYVVGLELLCACQAAEYRGIQNLSPAGKEVYEAVRRIIPTLKQDRIMSEDLERIAAFVRDDGVRLSAERVVGKLE